jgi:hypothetical protein
MIVFFRQRSTERNDIIRVPSEKNCLDSLSRYDSALKSEEADVRVTGCFLIKKIDQRPTKIVQIVTQRIFCKKYLMGKK